MSKKSVTSWSLSALKQYETCAYKYKRSRLDGVKEPTSYALERGIDLHRKLEFYLNGTIKGGVPRSLFRFETEIANLKKYGAIAEEQFVLNTEWKPLDDPKPWFSKKAWFRAKTDARVNNLVIDLKTGRKYDTHYEGAELYALIFLLENDAYDEVDVEFWYCDSGDMSNWTFYRKDVEETKARWQERADKLFNEKEWKPTINEYCKYCHLKKECPAQQ